MIIRYDEDFGFVPNAKSISKRKAMRKWLWEKQRHRCFWCNSRTKLPDGPPPSNRNTATLDHLVAKSAGGKVLLNNIVVACFVCNSDRGNRTARKTIQWLKKKLPRKKHDGAGTADD